MQFGLIEAVRHWGQYRRQKVALLSNGSPTTYGDLLLNAERTAQAIRDHGSVNRVAVAAKHKAAFVTALLGVMRAGKSAVILNPHLGEEPLRVTISNTSPELLVQDGELADTWSPRALAGVPRLTVDTLRREPVGNLPWPEYRSTTEWGVVFSSGSTDLPKGIERDHNSMVAEVVGWCLELPMTKNSVLYIGRPLFYTGGLVLTLASLFVGATVIANDYDDDDDPAKVWLDYQRELAAQEIEWAFFTPDQLRAFTRTKLTQRRYAKFILVMGAKITGVEKRAARDVLGSQIVESWGNSESLGTITEPEDLDRRPDSIGRPFLTDDLWVVDDSLKPCAPGELGRIAGADTAGFYQYSNRPDATKKVKRKALIISDDVGYTDETGYFFIAGRDQDLVVRGNASVFLPAIADKIRAREDVLEVELCASDVHGADEFVAAIVLASGVTTNTEELRASLNADLDSEEQLTMVVVLDALPRLASGKVDRLAVRRRVFENHK